MACRESYSGSLIGSDGDGDRGTGTEDRGQGKRTERGVGSGASGLPLQKPAKGFDETRAGRIWNRRFRFPGAEGGEEVCLRVLGEITFLNRAEQSDGLPHLLEM